MLNSNSFNNSSSSSIQNMNAWMQNHEAAAQCVPRIQQ
jgi:hypothetical protein